MSYRLPQKNKIKLCHHQALLCVFLLTLAAATATADEVRKPLKSAACSI